MQSLRTPFLVITGLALFAMTACDEFPEPVETGGGLIPVSLQIVDWPSELAIGASSTLEVRAVDQKGREMIDVPVQWQLVTPEKASMQAGSDELHRQVTGLGLGWATVAVSVTNESYVQATKSDSIRILLAGVDLVSPAEDVTLASVGETATLTGTGKSATGSEVSGAGLEWAVVSGSSVELSGSGDSVQVSAVANGVSQVQVSSPLCVTGGPCADLITVTVNQVADSVEIPLAADTLVSGDTLQLNATAYDANGNAMADEPLTWTTSDAAVATVDTSGRVVAQNTGEASIVAAAASGAADTTVITVQASGTLEVQLTDAPADQLESAVLHLSGVYVLDDVVSKGRRYVMDEPFTVDLLTLTSSTVALGTVRVPTTTYNDIFLQVDSVVLTLLSSYQFGDGTKTKTMIPPADTVAAPIHGSATFAADQPITVVVDFDVDGSFPMPEPDAEGVISSVSFTPDVRGVKSTDAASIAGSVGTTGTATISDLTLQAVRTSPMVDTVYTRTDAAGAFTFRYLTAGSYDITVPQAPACHIANPPSLNSAVEAGQSVSGVSFSIDPVTVDSVAITPSDATINALGNTVTLTATGYEVDTPLNGFAVTWVSLDPAVATVDGSGVVKGIASGTAHITATACSQADTAVVTVRQVPAEVTISPENGEAVSGGTQQFTAQLLDSAGVAIDTATFSWSSHDAAIATIDGAGLATALKSGSTTVEALHVASGVSGTATISVALGSATLIDVGSVAACAVAGSAEVVCWGANPQGQLGSPGTGDWETAHRPQTIPLPAGTYVDLAVGHYHACVLDTAGDVHCWGEGWRGALGNGLNNDQSTPVLVNRPAGETFTAITAGVSHTCATTASHEAYCWGLNGEGQLGTGNNTGANSPQKVFRSTGQAFDQIVAGENHTCALDDASGLPYCWGVGWSGQLGNNQNSSANIPQAVTMPSGVTFASLHGGSNSHNTCGVTASGAAYCWGNNNSGMIDAANQGSPVSAPRLWASGSSFSSLAMVWGTLCGAKTDGNVVCQGANWTAQYGAGYTGNEEGAPVVGAVGLSAAKIAGSSEAFCAIDSAGDPYCWGSKKPQGLLGTGETSAAATPVRAGTLTGVADLEKAQNRGCALTADAMYCWEWLWPLGMVGEPYATPTAVGLPEGQVFVEVALGHDHVCIRSEAGLAYCTGRNNEGQLGDGTTNGTQSWVQVDMPSGVTLTTVSAGWVHTCGMGSDGQPYCWGYNGYGAVGNGTTTDNITVPTPVAVPAGVSFVSVQAGVRHTCGIASSGAAYCWGEGGEGQLGNGTNSESRVPTQVASASVLVQISAGNEFTCALTDGGEAYCWGRGWDGQLGDNAASSSASPVAVAGGHLFSQVHAGMGNSTCGIKSSGAAYCWGAGWSGQLGNGIYDRQTTPSAAFQGLTTSSVSNAWGTTCALTSAGEVWCAGDRGAGDLADGERAFEWVPVRVGGSGSN